MEIRLNLIPMDLNEEEDNFIYERDSALYDILKFVPKKIAYYKKQYKYRDSNLSLNSEILDLYYGEV